MTTKRRCSKCQSFHGRRRTCPVCYAQNAPGCYRVVFPRGACIDQATCQQRAYQANRGPVDINETIDGRKLRVRWSGLPGMPWEVVAEVVTIEPFTFKGASP